MSADKYFSMTYTAPFSATPITVATTVGGTVIAAANDTRKEITLQNNGTQPCIICLGGTPTTTNYHLVLAKATANRDGLGASITLDWYKGAITGLTESSTTVISVMEIID